MTLEPHLKRGQNGHPFLTSIFKMHKSFQKASILQFKHANWYLHSPWSSAHNTWSSPLCDCNEHSPLSVMYKNHRPCQDVHLTDRNRLIHRNIKVSFKKADKMNYPHFLKKTEIMKLQSKKIFSYTVTLKKYTIQADPVKGNGSERVWTQIFSPQLSLHELPAHGLFRLQGDKRIIIQVKPRLKTSAFHIIFTSELSESKSRGHNLDLHHRCVCTYLSTEGPPDCESIAGALLSRAAWSYSKGSSLHQHPSHTTHKLSELLCSLCDGLVVIPYMVGLLGIFTSWLPSSSQPAFPFQTMNKNILAGLPESRPATQICLFITIFKIQWRDKHLD